MKLTTRILVGLLLGAIAGTVARAAGGFILDALLLIQPLGTAFIRLITMVVVPLVVASLFVGTCSIGDIRRLGRIGGRSLGYFLVTTIVAATIGLGIGLLVRPGLALPAAIRDRLAAQNPVPADRIEAAGTISIAQRLIEIIPRNPIEAAADMNLLPLIVATLLFAAAASVLDARRREPLVAFFDGVNGAASVLIGWTMKLAPFAVFVLIADAMARFGPDLLRGLLLFALLVIGGELLHGLGVLMLALRAAGIRPIRFWKHIADAPILAFSTASSNAALPVSLDVVQRNLGVSREVASFVLPIGATLNMNGSALYKGVTVVFLAQLYGVPLGPGDYVTIVLMSTAAALAGVGVPGSSLVTTVMVLNAIGMGPQAVAGIALVAGLDRFLDMFRTANNVLGDLTCAAIIAKLEGEDIRA